MTKPAISPVAIACGGLLSLVASMGMGRFVYTPILPLMAEGMPLSHSGAGFLASINFAGYLAGSILAALPGLPGSRRGWMLGGIAVAGVTTGAIGYLDSFLVMSVLRFIAGVASAFGFVFAAALVLGWVNAAGRPGLSAIHFAGVGSGVLMSAVLVSALTHLGIGWRGLWIAAGIAALIALIAVAFLVPDRQENRPALANAAAPAAASQASASQASSNASSNASWRALGKLILSYGLYGFGFAITATFLVALVRTTPATRSVEPFIWMVMGAAAIPSILIWNRIADRIGAASAYALACFVEALGVAASVLWPTIPGVLLAALLVGVTFVAITALAFASARRIAEGDQRLNIAVLTVSFSLGQIVGPALAGFAYDRTGSYLWPSLAGALALVLAGALTRWIPMPARA